MLILGRRAGQRIMIGSDVIVTILENSGDQVRIGISAPKDVSVHREEIYEKIMSEKANGKGEVNGNR